MKFVDNPTRDNEIKRDANVTSGLMNELPGLFNKAVQGLRSLNKRGYFILPDSHKLHMDAFEVNSNPVMDFYKHLPMGRLAKDHDRDEFYACYREWCEKNGERSIASRFFWQHSENIVEFKEVDGVVGKVIRFGEWK